MSMFDEFAATLQRRTAFSEASWESGGKLELQLFDDAIAEAKRRFPKRRIGTGRDGWIKAQNVLPPEVYAAIKAPIELEVEKWREERQRGLDEFDALLKILAGPAEIPKTEEPFCARTISGTDFGSQGFGANKYASGMAESIADDARFVGLSAEVRSRVYLTTTGSWPQTYMSYDVFVNTTPDGWAAAMMKPRIEMREVIRLCWKRGVNPRVYYPFLPHDFEEKQGIGYLGDDLNERAAA